MLIHSSVTGRRQWPPPVLTSAVCEAVEDVAFVTEALEASRRVDTEMVAGAVKGALVDVCVQRNTHSGKTPQITESATFPRCPLFTVCWLGDYDSAGKKWLLRGRRLLLVTCSSGQPPGVHTFTISRHRNGIFNGFVK